MRSTWWRRLAQQITQPRPRTDRRRRSARAGQLLRLETLEAREVPAVMAHPDFVVETFHSSAKPSQGGNGPGGGYSPSQIAQAYSFNSADTGSGTTIAIVDAYNDPNIQSDVATFDSEFGLPAASLTVVNQTGGSTLPKSNSSWGEEISLDVEWAHAMAPGAKILLVEASSASMANLTTAVEFASSQSNVVAVSMSWGAGESSGESSYDKDFTSSHNVVFVNSAGDSGSPADYPSASPNVLSVGGTSLTLSSSGGYGSESAWSDGGGGPSKYETEPSWQKGVVPTSMSTKRATPDVSYDANPSTGFSVYDSYGAGGWIVLGGTSCGSPQWAAIVADSDQALTSAGKADLTNTTLETTIYTGSSSDLHDITSGSNGTYSATTGYDLATGMGTPEVTNLISTLAGPSNPNAATHLLVTATSTSQTQGAAFTLTVEALTSSNQVATSYTGTVAFSSSDAGDTLPADYTFTSGTGSSFNNGIATFSVALNATGSDTVTVTDTSTSSIAGSDTFSVSSPYFTVTGPTTASAGTSEQFTVEAFNANGTENTSYNGTANLSSSDGKAVFPASVQLSGGTASFNVTFETAGTQSVTASSGSMTGSDTGIAVTPGTPTTLAFVQQPSNATVGSVISPGVTVEELDQYGNVINGSTVTLTLSGTPSDLSGTTSETTANGVATFSNLSVSAAGTYTLTATASSLTATSSSFTVSASTSTVIENFNNGLGNYYYTSGSYGYSRPEVETTTVAAHPGTATDGLLDEGDGNWYFREDSGAMAGPGNTIGTWVDFTSLSGARAYFGFGTTPNGLDSVALAPNTGQLIIMSNPGFVNYDNLAVASQSYAANTWYYVQIEWGTTGVVTATLSVANSSGGLTQLNSVTASTGDITPGTFAFRAINATTYFSTVTETTGAGSNAIQRFSANVASQGPASSVQTLPAMPYLPVAWGGIPVGPGSGYGSAAVGYGSELWYLTQSQIEEGWFGF